MELQQNSQDSNESLEDHENEDISIESDQENQEDELVIENEKLDFLVQTDQNGKVGLGPLKLINQVSVSLFQDKVKKSWVVEEISNKYSCSQQIGELKFKEGEDVILGGGIDQNQIENFVLVLQNESLKIDFKKGREIEMIFENGILKLKNLQAGDLKKR
ncbi:hypothetical protein PPERSA_02464 [Pseudocohnilembus persalinus]|uniref:Uncharacterized protein n=1 Tax=Pseudocohnilembus persalinus TaxID=266149 RepID=A0A0V0QAW9_PSEPJ|nr:hypothetical protein PPERSA_02464 [Pseudocohnilembus persalinus]|eukprot:KRW99352.1 hypothetical protein PPERSA_02464 [Pseudocohnilembus persalinus]